MTCKDSHKLAMIANQGLKALDQQLKLNGLYNLSSYHKAIVLRAIVNHLLMLIQIYEKDIISFGKDFSEEIHKDSSPRA